jgi:hypothetical protein
MLPSERPPRALGRSTNLAAASGHQLHMPNDGRRDRLDVPMPKNPQVRWVRGAGTLTALRHPRHAVGPAARRSRTLTLATITGALGVICAEPALGYLIPADGTDVARTTAMHVPAIVATQVADDAVIRVTAPSTSHPDVDAEDYSVSYVDDDAARHEVCPPSPSLTCVDRDVPAASQRRYIVTGRVSPHWLRDSAIATVDTAPPQPHLSLAGTAESEQEQTGSTPSNAHLVAPAGVGEYEVTVLADGAQFFTVTVPGGRDLATSVPLTLASGPHSLCAVSRFHDAESTSAPLDVTIVNASQDHASPSSTDASAPSSTPSDASPVDSRGIGATPSSVEPSGPTSELPPADTPEMSNTPTPTAVDSSPVDEALAPSAS